MKSVSAAELAHLLDAKIEGDPNVRVHKPAKIEEGEPGAISFLGNPKYESYLYNCASSIVLVGLDFEPQAPVSATLLRVKDVYASLSFLLQHFQAAQAEAPAARQISPQAVIDPSAKVAEGAEVGALAYVGPNAVIEAGVKIYPQAYIGADVKIGAGSIIEPGVRILKGCQIGQNCIIHANSVIGSDGFGFAPQADGSYEKIPQLGIVILEDQVEVGANTVIDRATMGQTLIKQGVKLDNLIQIAHNVEIGRHTAVAAQAGIAGSTKVGENCLIGGQVGLVGHIQLAKGTKIQAQSGINKSVKKENQALFGSPALPYNDFLRSQAVFKQLPRLQKEVNALRKALKALQEKED